MTDFRRALMAHAARRAGAHADAYAIGLLSAMLPDLAPDPRDSAHAALVLAHVATIEAQLAGAIEAGDLALAPDELARLLDAIRELAHGTRRRAHDWAGHQRLIRAPAAA
jgi:hypothetical protein